MRYSFVAIAVALFGHAVSASPITGNNRALPIASGATTIAASFPVSELSELNGVQSNSTLPGRSVRLAARQEFPANLLLCSGLNCGGSCQAFTTEGQLEDVCFSTTFFNSAAISQPSNLGLPFAVAVGTPGCATLVQLPAVNECFNVNGGPFNSFAFLP